MRYVYIYMLTLDVLKSCHVAIGNGIMYLEVWSMEECLSVHGQMKSTLYVLMEYEVVVYERETRKVVSSWEWRMCRKEEIMKCNHFKRNLSSGSQEDVTRRSPGKICRLWRKSGKEEDPWKNISLGDVSICMKDVDDYRKMSWWKIITEVTFVLKVQM